MSEVGLRISGEVELKWRMFLLSFSALFLELMIIRWVPSVVRLVAYYANLMLLSSFLGLGVGAMTSHRKARLFGWFPVLLLLDIGVLLLCRQVALGASNAEVRFYAVALQLRNYLILIGVFIANAVIFVPLGQEIGRIFSALPRLTAYAWDLGGSLCGTLSFGLFSFLCFSPMVGTAIVTVIYLILGNRKSWFWQVPAFAVVILGMLQANERAAIWSPYYYITVREPIPGAPALSQPAPNIRTMHDPPIYFVSVNQDFYQANYTLDMNRYTPGSPLANYVLSHYRHYMLPYALARGRERVLVLGAGPGNDVQAALLSGVRHVDAVEIDPVLVQISRRFSPAAPYDDPRVSVHVDDARAFLQRAVPGYDLVVFGFLDSQALFSYMSNIRLDGFVYTVESIRSAYGLLGEHGMLSISFYAAKQWLALKLCRMVAEGTGRTPIVYLNGGQIILCVPRGPDIDAPRALPPFQRVRVDDLLPVPPPTDDWPYLYLSKKTIPSDYLIAMGSLLALSLVVVLALRGGRFNANDGHFCFLGMGFLLLETKSISDCSLYFGATWLVTAIVVGGVLLMVLGANWVAIRLKRFSYFLYLPVFGALTILYFMPRDLILALPFAGRLLWTVLVVPLPIFCAGMIFSVTFRETTSPATLFGANLVGAMIGGFCEYLGMATGSQWLTLLVMGAYIGSLVFVFAARVSHSRTQSVGAGDTLAATGQR